jgi:hypothetical protein
VATIAVTSRSALQANKTDPKHLEHDWKERMRTSLLLIAAMIMLSPTLALAQSPTADLIAGIYGNTTNPRLDGHGVLPSLAPGPWACISPGDCSEAKAGVSVGEILSLTTGHGNADFANGTETTKTNFLNKLK